MLKTQCMVFFVVILVNLSFNEQIIIGSSCTVESTGAPGQCMLITNCTQVRNEVLTSQRLPQTCGFQDTQAIVCCPVKRKPGDISKKKCKEYSSYADEERSGGVKNYECENKTVNFYKRELAKRQEFPHMAAIGFENSPGTISWLCGGAIISERYIMTVQRCIKKQTSKPKLVRMGVTSLNDTEHRQDLKVLEVIRYPNSTSLDDITLLKLEKSIVFSSYTRPACLYFSWISYEQGFATGWVVTEEGTHTVSNNLLKLTLDVYPDESCYMIQQDLGVICAHSRQVDDCTNNGVTEGLLQIHHDGDDDIKCMYDIIGLASFGRDCVNNAKGSPSSLWRVPLFTRVSHYVKWIENTVWT